MHYKNLFPSDYLGAHDLRGRDVDLTIRAVVKEEIKTEKGPEMRACVYFEEVQAKTPPGEKEKRLVLNRTNGKTIAKMHGPEVEGWTGKRITLFPTTVDAFGEIKDCIRIRPSAPAPRMNTTTTTKTENSTNGPH